MKKEKENRSARYRQGTLLLIIKAFRRFLRRPQEWKSVSLIVLNDLLQTASILKVV